MSDKKSTGRVLGIVGSPRRGGNTEILVDEVLAGAEADGALTEKVILSKLNIGPCRGCDACGKTGKCVQQDDMHTLLEQMERSQVWVLGTPVYYWGPTAQFKAFVDRWYGAGKIVTFNGKRVILAIPLPFRVIGGRNSGLSVCVSVSQTIEGEEDGIAVDNLQEHHPDMVAALDSAICQPIPVLLALLIAVGSF